VDFSPVALGLLRLLSANTEEVMANTETVKQRMNFFMVIRYVIAGCLSTPAQPPR
jgi:hypothetical protein